MAPSEIADLLEAKKSQIRDILAQKKAKESFEEYCRFVGGVEPARHHRIMCAAFEPIVKGETRFIMVNAPPGSAKSTYASHLFPAYYASVTGNLVISGCHTYGLAESFGKKVRNYVSSERHQKVFPEARIRKDTRAASNWALENGAEYFGIGVGGGVAGKRADLLIVEDPYPNKKMARSPAYQKEVREWFTSDLLTRLRPGGSVILIFTRWDIRDLSKDVDELEKNTGVPWERIKFEAIREDEKLEDPLGREIGEALWPEWQDREALLFLKNSMPADEWDALFQQRPHNSIDADDLDIRFDQYDNRVVQRYELIFQSWDTGSSSDGHPSACVTFGYRRGVYDILDVFNERVLYPDLRRHFIRLSQTWNSRLHYVENASSGRSLIQEFDKTYSIIPVNPKKYGSKFERMEFSFPVIESGRVRLPEQAPWKSQFLEQFFGVLDGTAPADDIIDAFSQGIIKAEEGLAGKLRRRRRRMVPLQGAS